MRKYIIMLLAVIALFATSCVTQQKCNTKFPPQTNTITKDSVVYKDSIVYKPIKVPVYIKGDIVTKYDTIYKDNVTGLVNSKPVYAETAFAKAIAQVTNSKLKLQLIQKDSTFNVTLDSLTKEVYHWKNSYNSVVTNTVTTKEVKVGKFYIWFFWILLGIGTITMLWKNRGLIIKLIKPV